MQLRIDSITVGERRREELGDIEGLARSIERYGLIHPIVIDERHTLIAGGRRLEAAKRLGWDKIEGRIFTDLSEDEKREIELEENLRRKDLTPYELAKSLVRKATQVAPALARRISSESEEKDPRGRKPQYEAPKSEVAQALGVGVARLVAAEQHVAAAERYPELQLGSVSQDAAIRIAKRLDELPEEERSQRLERFRADGDVVATLTAGDPEREDLQAVLQFHRSVKRLYADLVPLNVEVIARRLDPGDYAAAGRARDALTDWFHRLDAARTRPMRLVKGAE